MREDFIFILPVVLDTNNPASYRSFGSSHVLAVIWETDLDRVDDEGGISSGFPPTSVLLRFPVVVPSHC